MNLVNQADMINHCIQSTLVENAKFQNYYTKKNEFEQFDDANLMNFGNAEGKIFVLKLDYEQDQVGKSTMPGTIGVQGFQFETKEIELDRSNETFGNRGDLSILYFCLKFKTTAKRISLVSTKTMALETKINP